MDCESPVGGSTAPAGRRCVSCRSGFSASGGIHRLISGGSYRPYSLTIAAAGGGFNAAETCEATTKAKTTAGRHINRKN